MVALLGRKALDSLAKGQVLSKVMEKPNAGQGAVRLDSELSSGCLWRVLGTRLEAVLEAGGRSWGHTWWLGRWALEPDCLGANSSFSAN